MQQHRRCEVPDFDFLLDPLYDNFFHYLIISAWKASCVCKSRSVRMGRTHAGTISNLQTELGVVFPTAQLHRFTYT